MSSWNKVGRWLKSNASEGAALVGSLLTGNVPGAIAAGVSMVSSVTGKTDPQEVLDALATNPNNVVELKKLALEENKSVREHLETMTRLEMEDEQNSHHETQETIRAGDKAEYWFVKITRPGQSWLSLIGALGYVGFCISATPIIAVDFMILSAMLALPMSYAGLRQIGKWKDSNSTLGNLSKKLGIK